jgi:hypothetical protein
VISADGQQLCTLTLAGGLLVFQLPERDTEQLSALLVAREGADILSAVVSGAVPLLIALSIPLMVLLMSDCLLSAAAGGVPQGGVSCQSVQELAPGLAAAGKIQLAAAGAGSFTLSSPATAGKDAAASS